MKKWFFSLLPFLLLLSQNIRAQQGKIDSLFIKLKAAKEDTNKVKLLNDLSFEYWDVNPDEGLKYAEQSLALAEKLKFKPGIAEAFSNMSRSYRRLTNITRSLDFGFRSLKMYEEAGDKNGIVRNLVNIGNTYRVQKDFGKSLEFLVRALKLNEETGDKIWTARNLNSIGNLYKDKKDYVKTLEYYSRSLTMANEIKNKGRIAAAVTNLGSVYGLMKYYSKALEYDFRALHMMKELGEKVGASECYINLGMVYFDLFNEPDKSKTNSFLQTDKMGFLNTAKRYCDTAIAMDKQIKHLEGLKWDYQLLIDIQIKLKDYKNAFECYKYFTVLKDSISNAESDRKISQLEKNNEEDRKQKEIEIQKLQIQSVKKQRIYFLAGIIMVIIFAGFIFRSLRITRKQKNLIEIKNNETEAQKKLIEEKQKEILDSIQYAKRIQTALITNEKYIDRNLNKLSKD